MLSIAQAGKSRGQAGFPCFAGFYGCFLESGEITDAGVIYTMCLGGLNAQDIVVSRPELKASDVAHNQSARDGTEVIDVRIPVVTYTKSAICTRP